MAVPFVQEKQVIREFTAQSGGALAMLEELLVFPTGESSWDDIVGRCPLTESTHREITFTQEKTRVPALYAGKNITQNISHVSQVDTPVLNKVLLTPDSSFVTKTSPVLLNWQIATLKVGIGVRLSGEFNERSLAPWQELLGSVREQKALNSSDARVVLDFKGIPQLSLLGLAFLAYFYDSLDLPKERLWIINANPAVRELLDRVRFHRYFTFHE